MFYMNEKLVHSIQSDRHREAQAARLNTVHPTDTKTLVRTRRRLFSVPSIFLSGASRNRTVVSRTTEAHRTA